MSISADFDGEMERLLEDFPDSKQPILLAWFQFYNVHNWNAAEDFARKYIQEGFDPTSEMLEWL